MAFATLALALTFHAEARDEDEARRIAVDAISKVSHRLKASTDGQMPGVEIVNDPVASADSRVRVFSSREGFAVVSLNDNTPALLAVSERPISSDGGNPAFRQWLKAVTAVANEAATPLQVTTPDPDKYRTEVEPLISTQWGQFAPFFYMCPMENPSEHVGEYYPADNHCVVGCVAVTAAQIMNYYRFPSNGKGSAQITMTDWDSLTDVVFSVNFGESTYDYDNMLLSYPEDGYSETQGRAVAQLMYHCGVMSDMIYSIDGSGTSNGNAINGMIDHFDYDSAGEEIDRYFSTEKVWMNTLYDEINQNRPVMYAGYTYDEATDDIGGHSFIIDGYDADGMVHVNWGWAGDSDGMYDISILNPPDTGWSFEYYQSMVIGVRPNPSAVDVVKVNPAVNAPTGVFSIDGRRLRSDGASRGSLPPGFYIIDGKKCRVNF